MQYAALDAFFPDHKKVFMEWSELYRACTGLEGRFVFGPQLPRLLPAGRLLWWVKKLVRLRLIGEITEIRGTSSYELVQKRGLIPNVFFAHRVYMQHADVVKKLGALPQLKPEVLAAARGWLRETGLDDCERPLVFVHVRRGDYKFWPTREHPAILPVAWYQSAMRKMRNVLDDPIFVLVGDDPYYLRDVFEASDSLVISENAPEVDLALCMLCDHGILSASSFAWWAAYSTYLDSLQMAGKGGAEHAPIFFAPEFWGGVRMREWFPMGFKFDWIEYLDLP